MSEKPQLHFKDTEVKCVGFSLNLLGMFPLGGIAVNQETVLYLPHQRNSVAI